MISYSSVHSHTRILGFFYAVWVFFFFFFFFFFTFLDATPYLPSGRYMPGIIFLPPVREESQFVSRPNGHKFEQTPGDSEGQGTLMCCSPQGHKELDMTEPLNNKSCLLGAERVFFNIITAPLSHLS